MSTYYRSYVYPSVALITSLVGSQLVFAERINFGSVSHSAISSSSGQDFRYTTGHAGETGTLNVRSVSGDFGVQPGNAPDPNGLYVLQSGSGPLNLITLRFTFDIVRTFEIQDNETTAALEHLTFSMPSGDWVLLDSQHAVVVNNGSEVSISGENNSAPWGYYSIRGTSAVFDWSISNDRMWSDYGSAISIDVVPSPSSVPEIDPSSFGSALALTIGSLGLLERRRSRYKP